MMFRYGAFAIRTPAGILLADMLHHIANAHGAEYHESCESAGRSRWLN
jgi:hypothetical protein